MFIKNITNQIYHINDTDKERIKNDNSMVITMVRQWKEGDELSTLVHARILWVDDFLGHRTLSRLLLFAHGDQIQLQSPI